MTPKFPSLCPAQNNLLSSRPIHPSADEMSLSLSYQQTLDSQWIPNWTHHLLLLHLRSAPLPGSVVLEDNVTIVLGAYVLNLSMSSLTYLMPNQLSCPLKSCQSTSSISPIHLLPMSTAPSPSLDPIHLQLYLWSGPLVGLPDFSLYPLPFSPSPTFLQDKPHRLEI